VLEQLANPVVQACTARAGMLLVEHLVDERVAEREPVEAVGRFVDQPVLHRLLDTRDRRVGRVTDQRRQHVQIELAPYHCGGCEHGRRVSAELADVAQNQLADGEWDVGVG
jgi:hypothetical protein